MRRLICACALAALATVGLMLPTAAPASGGPTAVAAKRCHLTLKQQRHLGTTYVLNLSVSGGPSCSGGRKLVKAYHACRHGNGGADGRCGRVSGYSCSERRFNKSRFSYDATATCRKGGRSVKHTYTQNI
jgi:hypothetical protein